MSSSSLSYTQKWAVDHAGCLAQKNLELSLVREERVALVDRARSEFPLSVQADLLSLSRASLYYQPRPPSAEEVRLKTASMKSIRSLPFMAPGRSQRSYSEKGWASIGKRSVGI